jgi:hypothetical protein
MDIIPVKKIAAWIPFSADLIRELDEDREYMRAAFAGEITPSPVPARFSSLTGRPAGPLRRATD